MTVRVWRIGTDTPAWTADDLSGTGAKITGGRWNRAGKSVVYASSSPALACLETIVHLGAAALPLNRYLVAIDIPEEVFARRLQFEELAPAAQRVGWDALPPGRVSLELGDAWLTACRSAMLELPSVIVPEDRNLLINPAHPDATAIKATKLRRFEYDCRLR
ncbi:MAG: RES family NAD+ phosphorylase [Thauera sp.]|nr:RES family NAD+ phosphorylase [Thauera sp.]